MPKEFKNLNKKKCLFGAAFGKRSVSNAAIHGIDAAELV
jgi:hypothetical protein